MLKYSPIMLCSNAHDYLDLASFPGSFLWEGPGYEANLDYASKFRLLCFDYAHI